MRLISKKISGLKIFSARIKGSNRRQQIIKDSLNFLPGSLARLYDTFSLDGTGITKKPAFPHLFNKKKNIGKITNSLPALKYYSLDKMKGDEAEAFMNWHKENEHKISFDLKSALLEYCSNDVFLLRYNLG
jgi:hypothetical protein